eukprot:CAMPEP_0168563220 /NCGR_PEP_ID=MMETSP0413-20121227/12560_1 /TAXON_ID=136452 /ORGANISM="Filamoeba nolandi, Strain NC-AS-23-1" /LENGTH=184 /DNA_ID=CAMNT_0008594739 /DNA_START=111 /DNA_END=665 /DNA_ORIENTATION=+
MSIRNLLNPEPLPTCRSILAEATFDLTCYSWRSSEPEPTITKRRKSIELQTCKSVNTFVDELASACELLTRFQNTDLNQPTTSSPPLQRKFVPIAGFFENQWNVRFAELIKFKQEHGHTNVTRAAEHKILGNWVAEQRRKWKKGKLPQKHQKALEEIGFEWDRSYYFLPNHSPAEDRDDSSSSS